MDYRLTPQRYRQVLGRAQAAPARQTQLTPTTMYHQILFAIKMDWIARRSQDEECENLIHFLYLFQFFNKRIEGFTAA